MRSLRTSRLYLNSKTMRHFIQVLIKTGLTLNFIRLIPLGLLSCFAAVSLYPSFAFLHIALVIGEMFSALYLVLDHHCKPAWMISLVLHLYEASFWCLVFFEEGLSWANGVAFPLPPFFISCLAAYVLYQYYGYEKARKYHSAV